jgi:hypothetical protein
MESCKQRKEKLRRKGGHTRMRRLAGDDECVRVAPGITVASHEGGGAGRDGMQVKAQVWFW